MDLNVLTPPDALRCCDAARAQALRDHGAFDTDLAVGMAPFQVLAHPVRLRIVAALQALGELCVCDAGWVCGTSVALTSHHLKALHDAGLVERRRDGRLALYELTPRATRLLEFVLEESA